PLPLPEGTGLGKPLRSPVHPLRAALPIHLAAAGPRNIALAADIARGGLPLVCAARTDATSRELVAGRAGPGAPGRPAEAALEVSAAVPVVVREHVEQAADQVRPFRALYVGGMGAKGANFHRDALDRLGYAEACDEIQAHYLAGRKDLAAAAVPTAMVEDVALVGPPDKIARDLAAWRETAVTTLLVQGDATAVTTLAPLLAQTS